MGRYCFYCGRQLEPGETCDCRYSKERQKQNAQFFSEDNNTDQSEINKDSINSSDSSFNNSSKTTNDKSFETAAGAAASQDFNNSNNSANSKFNTYQQSNNSANSQTVEGFQESREEHSRRERKKQAAKNQGEKKTFFHNFFKQNHKSNSEPNKRTKAKPKRPKGNSNNRASVFLKNIFTSPSQTISDAKYASVVNIIVTNLIQALMFALVMYLFVRNSNFIHFLVLQDYGISYDALIQKSAATFGRAFVAALFIALMRVLIGLLIFKVFNRQKLDFQDLWKIYLPGTYYEIIALLISLLFSSGSGLQTLVMIIFSSFMRLVVDTLSLGYSMTLNTDKLIIQSSIANVILAVIMSLTINFILPSIARFGVKSNGAEHGNNPPNVYYQGNVDRKSSISLNDKYLEISRQ